MTKTLNLLLAALMLVSTTACTSVRTHQMTGNALDLPAAISAAQESGHPLTLTTQADETFTLHHPARRADQICGRLNQDAGQETCVDSAAVTAIAYSREETDTGQTLGVVAIIALAIGAIAVIDFSDDVSDAVTGALRG